MIIGPYKHTNLYKSVSEYCGPSTSRQNMPKCGKTANEIYIITKGRLLWAKDYVTHQFPYVFPLYSEQRPIPWQYHETEIIFIFGPTC